MKESIYLEYLEIHPRSIQANYAQIGKIQPIFMQEYTIDQGHK